MMNQLKIIKGENYGVTFQFLIAQIKLKDVRYNLIDGRNWLSTEAPQARQASVDGWKKVLALCVRIPGLLTIAKAENT